MFNIQQGDCFKLMQSIPEHNIDLILCDPPYNTSSCDFDKDLLNLDQLWTEFRRVIKDDGMIVMFAQQPFTTRLISSNLKAWKYNWIWRKSNSSNFLNANRQPLKMTEDICVFQFGKPRYYPQFAQGKSYSVVAGQQRENSAVVEHGSLDTISGHKTVNTGFRYPTNILEFLHDRDKYHPTQKPVKLLEYLISTYSRGGGMLF